MQSEFSIRVAGRAGFSGARTMVPVVLSGSLHLPADKALARKCRGVRMIVWEVLQLARCGMHERRDRRTILCQTRRISAYVCHVALRMPLQDVALGFGRDRTTVCHDCHVIEDRRDDRQFDAFVSAVERMAIAAYGQEEGVLND